jgi:hypothetical protein
MATIHICALFACATLIAAPASQAPNGSPPLLDPAELNAIVDMFGPIVVFFTFFVYIPLTVVGAIAWRQRGKARPPERLPSRERALPPPPRGPGA